MRLLARPFARPFVGLFRFLRRLAGWEPPAPPPRRPRPGEPGYLSGSDLVRIRRLLRRRFPSPTIATLFRRRQFAVARLVREPQRNDLRRQLLELTDEIDRRIAQGF